MNVVGSFDHTMNLLENCDKNIMYLEDIHYAMNLLDTMDHLWEAERSYYQYFDLNYPPPSAQNTPSYVRYLPPQPQNFPTQFYYDPARGYRSLAQDVEVLDDDIAIISSNTFHQARKKARRNPPDAAREDLNIGIQMMNASQFSGLSHTMPPPPQFLQSSNNVQVLQPQPSPPAPTPAPAFHCPICMDELQEATSTRCGHVFCKDCINQALAVRKKCPTCRTQCRAKSTFRIYLPTAR